jgi:hypothetical protein
MSWNPAIDPGCPDEDFEAGRMMVFRPATGSRPLATEARA